MSCLLWYYWRCVRSSCFLHFKQDSEVFHRGAATLIAKNARFFNTMVTTRPRWAADLNFSGYILSMILQNVVQKWAYIQHLFLRYNGSKVGAKVWIFNFFISFKFFSLHCIYFSIIFKSKIDNFVPGPLSRSIFYNPVCIFQRPDLFQMREAN